MLSESLEKDMNKKIRLSPSAKRDLSIVLEYLNEKWSSDIAANFIEIFQLCLKRISDNPDQFPYFRKDLSIRKCVITRHNIIYFKDGALDLQVIRIFDSRQNPDKLKF
jgi:plasmid stabilization system protein ParE